MNTVAGPVCGATSSSCAYRHRPRADVAGQMMSRRTRHVSQSQQSCANVKASSQATRTPNPRSRSPCAPELTELASSDSTAFLAASSRAITSASSTGGVPSRQIQRHGCGTPAQHSTADARACADGASPRCAEATLAAKSKPSADGTMVEE